VTVKEIVSHVCREFSIREEDLAGSGKDRRYSRPRAVAACLVRGSDCLTLAELGQRVHRDSSTLSAAAKELEGETQTDRELTRLMTKIREELS